MTLDSALRFCQCLLITFDEAWVLDKLACGEGGKLRDADINADVFLGRRQRFRIYLDYRKAGKPLTALPPDRAGFTLPTIAR